MEKVLDRKYKVYFGMPSIDDTAIVTASVEFTGLLGNIRSGFWIDKNMKYVSCEGSHWFVPPSQIVGIERIK